MCQLYTKKMIELKLTQFVFVYINLWFSRNHVTSLGKKMEIVYGLWRSNCMLLSRSHQNFMPLKHQHVDSVRSASVVPKRYNRLTIHCYTWVRQMPIVPKCNNGSLIHCCVWVRNMLIVLKLHVYRNFKF